MAWLCLLILTSGTLRKESLFFFTKRNQRSKSWVVLRVSSNPPTSSIMFLRNKTEEKQIKFSSKIPLNVSVKLGLFFRWNKNSPRRFIHIASEETNPMDGFSFINLT